MIVGVMQSHVFQPNVTGLVPRASGKPVVVVLSSTPPRTLRTGTGLSRRHMKQSRHVFNYQGGRIACSTGDAVTTKEDEAEEEKEEEDTQQENADDGELSQTMDGISGQDLPEGSLVYSEPNQLQKLCTSFKLIFALPWRRFKKGSMLTMKLEGAIQERLPGMFSQALSLPAICESLVKAAYDPRVMGVYLKVGPLNCGWAKVVEIRRHLEFFRKSGKFTIGYMERGNEKEYFLLSACEEIYLPPSGSLGLRGLAVSGSFLRGALDKIGVEPQVRRIGKYKSAGDQLLREDMSDPQREQLSCLLEDLYDGFVDGVSKARGKTPDEVGEMLENGFIDIQEFKEGGWITDLKYMDEVIAMIKERQGIKKDGKRPKNVTLKRYKKVSPSAFGLSGRKIIAIIRVSGAIVGGRKMSGMVSAPEVIKEIQRARDNKAVKAIVLRVDSPGGDALASDLMWREIKIAAERKPVIASMSDVAASGGYYLAMGAKKIIAEGLTITGSIGVVLAKFSLEELYKKVGVSKETLSKGRYAELFAENRGFSEDEEDYFTRLAEHAYEDFVNKAAESRNMDPGEMQLLAQGRVWSGRQAVTVRLVDGVGGISRAIAVAKDAAEIPQDAPVRLLELSKEAGSPLEALQGAGALTEVVTGAIFVVAGLVALVTGRTEGDRINAAVGSVLGLLGIVGPGLRAERGEAEYLMDDVTMGGSSRSVAPQAIMDSTFLDEGNVVSPFLKDLISRIL